MDFIEEAVKIAKQSTCERWRCGSAIVKDNEIIGQGYNSPSNNLESQRRCNNNKDEYHKKVTDKTCCMHAEQRAIMDALKNNPTKLKDSKLYFIRLDRNDQKKIARNPYCTICSKMALDAGIKYFILLHENGIKEYLTEEYNSLSYNYQG
ncbi:MAG: hypothetical protein AABX10_01745 [Nanoarchaeota archaeon]